MRHRGLADADERARSQTHSSPGEGVEDADAGRVAEDAEGLGEPLDRRGDRSCRGERLPVSDAMGR